MAHDHKWQTVDTDATYQKLACGPCGMSWNTWAGERIAELERELDMERAAVYELEAENARLREQVRLAIESIEDMPHPESCRYVALFRLWQTGEQLKWTAPTPEDCCDCGKQAALEKLK